MNTGKPDGVQILFVEMQPPIIASLSTQGSTLRRAAAAVKQVADALAIPMTASVVPIGVDAPSLIDELGSLDVVVRKTVSVLADDACRRRLADQDRQLIALAGVSSEIAILHTALDARRAGYEVAVLIDCCGGLSPRTEATALDQMRTADVRITNISTFFTGLFSDMTSPEGGVIMGALADLWSWNVDARTASVERDVAELFAAMADAWRAGDADRFAASFTDDATFIAFDGSVLTGAEAIADFHRMPFATYLNGSGLILKPSSVHAMTDAIVLVSSQGGITRDGKAQGELIGDSAQTFVLAKSQAGLKVRSFQNTRIRPMGEQGSMEVWRAFDRAWQDRTTASRNPPRLSSDDTGGQPGS